MGEDDSYSDDFSEATESLDEVLQRLASDKALPVQISLLRRRADADLQGALDQLAIDVVAAQRRSRRLAAAKTAEQRSARVRADERRRRHDEELAKASAAAAAAVAAQRAAEEARLGDQSKSLEREQASKVELEARAKDSARMRLQLQVLEATGARLEMRYEALLDRLPDVEARRVRAEDERLEAERQALAAVKEQLARAESTFRDRVDRAWKELEDERARRAAEFARRDRDAHVALETAKTAHEAAARRDRERLAAETARTEARAAAVDRDVAVAAATRSKLEQDRAAFEARVHALAARFEEAELAEARAADRLRAAHVVEQQAHRLLEDAQQAPAKSANDHPPPRPVSVARLVATKRPALRRIDDGTWPAIPPPALLEDKAWPAIPPPPPPRDDKVVIPRDENIAAPPARQSRLQVEIGALPPPGVFAAAARRLASTWE